jgi:outer membrane protein OmpA-like peptidoglycan-associated protein
MARRTARGHAEEENFLVSSADLMACVLFVFILLALVFAMKARSAQAVAVSKSQELDKSRAKWGDTSKAREAILQELRKGLEERGIVVSVNQDNDGLRFPEGTLTFDQCSNELRNSDRMNLATLAEVLGPVLRRFSQVCGVDGSQKARPEQQIDAVLVEGHTDRRAPAPGCGYRDNWELSAARASATRNLILQANSSLVSLCNAQSRPLFAIAGYADDRPASANDNDNRRIELRLIMRPPAIESTDAR